MTAHRSVRIGMAALAMALTAVGVTQAAQPGGPPGQAPTEVTGSVAVTNFPAFPANQDVTVNNEVDVNVTNSRRIQISIIRELSGDQPAAAGTIVRADGGGTFSVVPAGKKLVLTDFIISIGVPNDPVIGDNDDFLANISRAGVGGDCGSSVRRWQYRVFRRDQIVAALATGLEYFPGEQVCLATGAQGQAPKNVGVTYQIMGYLTDAP